VVGHGRNIRPHPGRRHQSGRARPGVSMSGAMRHLGALVGRRP
jgi:hypothetical protein